LLVVTWAVGDLQDALEELRLRGFRQGRRSADRTLDGGVERCVAARTADLDVEDVAAG